MKKMLTVLSVISLFLFALVNFGKHSLETYLSVQLMINHNHGSSAYIVDTRICQIVLIAVAVVCLVAAIVETLKEKKK